MDRPRNFSSFNLPEAYKLLGINTVQSWEFESHLYPPSQFFTLRLQRLHKNFDLRRYEKSKELLIDAYCEEAIHTFESLKIWKGDKINSIYTRSHTDYLITNHRDNVEYPSLCIVAARRNEFEQGLARCLTEMYACQCENADANIVTDHFGIVTNTTTWQFYKLSAEGRVYGSRPYTSGDPAQLLGALRYVFQQCLQPQEVPSVMHGSRY